MNSDMIIHLSEKAQITMRDAGLLFQLVSLKEIFTALTSSRVWELRDQALMKLRDELNQRYPV